MLHAACSFCRVIVPLYCGGRFMPHYPVPVFRLGISPACQICGPMPPIFTCMHCGMQQPVLLAGAPIPQRSFAGPSYVAPVFEAPQNASPSFLREVALSFVKSMAGDLGREASQFLIGQFSGQAEFGAY